MYAKKIFLGAVISGAIFVGLTATGNAQKYNLTLSGASPGGL